MGTVNAGGSIGPRYEPDQKALQRLEAYPETIHVDDLGDFGFHREIIEGLRVHQSLVSNAQVRAWIERGIPSRPEGHHGPRGETGPLADMTTGHYGHQGPTGPTHAGCPGVGCPRCDKSLALHCPHAVGEPGPPGSAGKAALPWYVEHLMRQQRRQNRIG